MKIQINITISLLIIAININAQSPVSLSMRKPSQNLQCIKAENINDTALAILNQGNVTNQNTFYTQIAWLDSNKNLIWCKSLVDTLFSISPYDITYTNDSNLLIVGSLKEMNTLKYKSFLTKITTRGDTIYTFVFD